MKSILFSLVLCLGLVTSCARPVTIVTPEGKIAYTAEQLVSALGNLQDVAIQLNEAGKFSTDTTRIVVTSVRDAVRVIRETPSGAVVTVNATLKQLATDLPASEAQKLSNVLNVLRSMIGES